MCVVDAHLGKGVSIGTVFASEKYTAPMAVGVDIGALSDADQILQQAPCMHAIKMVMPSFLISAS